MGHLTACHEEHTRNKKALEGLTVCRLSFYVFYQLTCYVYIISQGLMKFNSLLIAYSYIYSYPATAIPTCPRRPRQFQVISGHPIARLPRWFSPLDAFATRRSPRDQRFRSTSRCLRSQNDHPTGGTAPRHKLGIKGKELVI